MPTETRTTNAGPVGLKPKGDYQATATYSLLDFVRHNSEAWVCTAMNADGSAREIIGQEPAASSQYWMQLTEFAALIAAVNASAANADGKATLANEKAALANEKAALANEKAALADEKASLARDKADYATNQGDYAKAQGDYAKTQGDYAKTRGDYPDQIRSDGYVWTYDPDNAGAGADGYYRTAYKVDASLDFDALTPEQYQTLVENVKENMVFASPATCESIIDEIVHVTAGE